MEVKLVGRLLGITILACGLASCQMRKSVDFASILAAKQIQSKNQIGNAIGDEPRLVPSLATNMVWAVAYATDGRLALTGGAGGLHIWEVASGRELRNLAGCSGIILSAMFSENNTEVIAGCSDGTAFLWDAIKGTELRRFESHSSNLSTVYFVKDTPLILTADKEAVNLWDKSTGERIWRRPRKSDPLFSIPLSPRGDAYITRDNGLIQVWDIFSGKEFSN